MQRIVLIGVVFLLVLGTNNAAMAQAQSSTTAMPSVTPLATTATSHPWLAWAPLNDGYVEEEFQLSGMAGIYNYASSRRPLGPDAPGPTTLHHAHDRAAAGGSRRFQRYGGRGVAERDGRL